MHFLILNSFFFKFSVFAKKKKKKKQKLNTLGKSEEVTGYQIDTWWVSGDDR